MGSAGSVPNLPDNQREETEGRIHLNNLEVAKKEGKKTNRSELVIAKLRKHRKGINIDRDDGLHKDDFVLLLLTL